MKNNVTIYTLAEELGMTPSMVSRAFNPNARIAKDKREAVLEAAKRYGFSPNKLASRLSQRTLKIGILIVYKAEHVRDGLLEGFAKGFDSTRDYKTEYTVTLVRAAEKSADKCREELFAFEDYDGVILSGFSSDLCAPLLREFSEVNPNLVFVQNLCEDAPRLFSSKHDEELAAALSAQLLYERLYHKERKNVLLFTGDLSSSVHKRARASFEKSCAELGLSVIDRIDMKDSDSFLAENIDGILDKYGEELDGVYITSGNSSVLCESLRSRGIDTSLVLSDVHSGVCESVADGVAFAAICQNFAQQAQVAFERLVEYLAGGRKPNDIYYSQVIPVFKSTLELYRNK